MPLKGQEKQQKGNNAKKPSHAHSTRWAEKNCDTQLQKTFSLVGQELSWNYDLPNKFVFRSESAGLLQNQIPKSAVLKSRPAMVVETLPFL
jgi:hypothetical protein